MSLGLRLYLASARRAGRLQDNSTAKRLARPSGKLLWLNISEQRDLGYAQELIQQFAEDLIEVSFLVTTSNDLVVDIPFQDSCEQPCLHITTPADTPQAVAKFLDHWQPSVCIWVGSTLRPALLVDIHTRTTPLMMLNVQSAARIVRQTRWNKGLISASLELFDHVLVNHEAIKQQLISQGASPQKIIIGGQLEETAQPPYCDDRDRDEMALVLAARPVWLAAFTTQAEETPIINAHRTAMRLSHRLLLILAPDDPDRGDALAQSLTDKGWIVAQRHLDQDPDENTQIFIADTFDEMGLWLRLAPVCFMGNSLVKDARGVAPGPASALGAAVLHGPYVDGFKTQYARLNGANAAREVADEVALALAVQELLAPDKAAEMAHAGWEITTSGAEAMERTMALIYNEINQPSPSHSEAM